MTNYYFRSPWSKLSIIAMDGSMAHIGMLKELVVHALAVLAEVQEAASPVALNVAPLLTATNVFSVD